MTDHRANTTASRDAVMTMALTEAISTPTPDSRSGFSLGHPLVWLGITMIVLVAGYTWLSVYTGRPAATGSHTVVKRVVSQGSDDIEDNAVSKVAREEQMKISRGSDDGRVREYFEYEAVEQQILPLLDAADVHFELGKFVNPPGDNAWEDYQSILVIKPGESVAVAGLSKIKSRLISGAEQSIDEGDFAKAENWLVQLDKIQPGDPTQADLRAELSQFIAAEAERKLRQQEAEVRQQKIETSLAQAKEEEGKIPLNYNILIDLFNRVDELDPENREAREGLIRLSDRKLDEVEQWLRSENFEEAEKGLSRAISIFPENKRISSLTLALDASLKQRQLEQQQLAQQHLEQQQRAELAAEEEKRKKREAEKLRQQQLKDQSSAASNQTTKSQPETLPTIPDVPPETVPLPVTPVKPAASVTASTAKSGARKPTAEEETLRQGVEAYYNGDYNRSFELLYPLAQLGVPRAQFRIGIMYQFGRSVSINTDLAEKWFTLALPELLREAQLGSAWAQTDLGTAYEFGISLQQDYERAAYWYQRAADQGYSGAQTNLGVLYAQGDGVTYDRAKAVFWLRKASDQGDRVARENLTIMGETP